MGVKMNAAGQVTSPDRISRIGFMCGINQI